MLIEISIANYRSFSKEVTLSLEVESRLSERDKSVDERNIAETQHGKLLRVAGIYGANASGKTNFVRGLAELRWLVLDSAREGQSGDTLPAVPFRLDQNAASEPSEVEVVYTEGDQQFRYGAAFTREKITREWLFVRPAGADHPEELWFDRTEDHYETGDGWERDRGNEKKTRPEALHISVAAAWDHEQATKILRWFRNLRVINNLNTQSLTDTTRLLRDAKHQQRLRDLIRQLDFGIDDIQLRPISDESLKIQGKLQALASALGEELGVRIQQRSHELKTVHRGVEFALADESAGTRKAISLAGPLLEALATGDPVIIDEFDSRLHTHLAKQLIQLFQDPAVNRRNAQLVFTSHDTNLLTHTLLRRDQLWFTEKSRKTQASDLYSLAELRFPDGKRVRNDARYGTDYLQGRYGAIPFFGNLQAILGESQTDEG